MSFDARDDTIFEFDQSASIGVQKSGRSNSSTRSTFSTRTSGSKGTSLSLSSSSFGGSKRRRRIRKRSFEDETTDEEESLDSEKTSWSPVKIVRKKHNKDVGNSNEPVSVLRGGFSAYAVQDAGTFQMLHDECSYLCSTMLSRTVHLGKAIDAGIELVTLLSCRKTRALLWQGGEIHESSEDSSRASTRIPKVWSSIFDVLSMVAISRSSNQSSGNASSTSSSSATASARGLPKVHRTKSARRKERELGGNSSRTRQNTYGFQGGNVPKMTHEFKELLTCIAFYISWDCTLSSDHSIAAMGPVRSPHLARKIRIAILENGGVLASIVKLMAIDSPPLCTTEGAIEAPISPLLTARISTRATPSLAFDQSMSAMDDSSLSSKGGGDPTARGRRNRKRRRKLHSSTSSRDDTLSIVPREVNLETISEDLDTQSMPPPKTTRTRKPIPKHDPWSFDPETNDEETSMASDSSAFLTAGASQKIKSLCSNLEIESLHMDGKNTCKEANGLFPAGDSPWRTMVCLESLTRILTGKELNGNTSCLEGDDSMVNQDRGSMDEKCEEDSQDESSNVFVVTNRLLGKSGVIPLLASAMSESMLAATNLVFPKKHRKEDIEEQWVYCHIRLKLLASLIDEACFFSEQNRRSFCEDDPFSFDDQRDGLIFYLLLFLHECSKCDLHKLNPKRSETMSLALRTLTSLTHDNPLSAEQMKNERDSYPNGIEVLAKLILRLEKSVPPSKARTPKTTSFVSNSTKISDHDMHRYDGTIFCLTTLANIIEAPGVCSTLLEIKIGPRSGTRRSWVQWLCQWIMEQTQSFRQEILSIGAKSTEQNNGKKIKSKRSATVEQDDGELEKHEEEKLVAAGNACVVLACLMTDADDEDFESSMSIRTIVRNEMSLDTEENSSGMKFVVNTMKAYCNYYHISMGQMSFAVVAPVKKLISELEEIVEFDDSKSEDSDGL